ncbi:orotidine-5'-phosphate decarboxylase [Fodinibius sp. Rm-B-1B1-1]|uniref:orotidine-5'-phosphate decarboxylase n=1 Tax=Fodinibius alkaliphilus TaxID=3140241 RepID=UPI00315A3474
MTFNEKLLSTVKKNRSTLCVGLDPNLDLMPEPIISSDQPAHQKVEQFLKKVINVTADYCAAYKPNLGFFEALGPNGWDTFANILDHIPEDKIVIADAKRGDISSTAEHYAKAFFKRFAVDAVTLNPLMGFETLDPFLNNATKGVYVLTLTSNIGAKDILLKNLSNGKTVSSFIAKELRTKQRNSKTAIGMVVGATKANELTPVINQFSESPLLIPGVGKQGGSISALNEVLDQHSGIPLINSSRSIIYAGGDSSNWATAVAESAQHTTAKLAPITKRYV